MPHLEARCRVEHPGFVLEADLDLRFEGVAAIVGASGSGKTTLLRAVAGIEPRARGKVALDGEAWQDDASGRFVPPHRRRVGFVFQDARLFPHLSVRSNLLYGFRRTPVAERRLFPDRVIEVLELGRLLDRRIGGLSGGERQRLAIGRALLSSPRLLLLDEPLSAVDVAHRSEILPFLERTARDLDVPFLYVSHALDEVLTLATAVVVLASGRIVAAGPIAAVASELHRLGAAETSVTLLEATVRGHEPDLGITRLAFAGGEIFTSPLPIPLGATVRVRIPARDVALSLDPPRRSSILNVLPGTVVGLYAEAAGRVRVELDVGAPLAATITQKSVEDLGLVPGQKVWAFFKAVIVDLRSVEP